MMQTDYLPLKHGLKLEYDGEHGSRQSFEVLGVREEDGAITAQCRWTYDGEKGRHSRVCQVVKDGSWAREGGRKLFPIPPKVGARWRDDRYEYAVESLNASVDLGEYGVIKGCLRITWHFDEGGGEAFYAPGLGLVRDFSTDEDDPYERVLCRPPG